MKINKSILIITFILLILLTGCNKQTNDASILPTDNHGDLNQNSTYQQTNLLVVTPTPSVNNTETNTGKTETIEDITKWNSPVKDIIKKWGYTITKVELQNNKTYPIYYIKKGANSEDVLYKFSFLKEVAEGNGFINYKLIDSTGKYNTVECNQSTKSVVKATNSKGTTDYSKYDYSSFNGKWYSSGGPNFDTKAYIIELTFNSDGKTAKIHISGTNSKNKIVDEYYNTTFDYSGRGRIKEFASTKDNEIILSKEKQEVDYYVINTIIPMGTKLIRNNDFEKITKCMDVAAIKEGIKDWKNRSASDELYLVYEGKNEDGKYIIAVRYSSDTVIKYWYYFDPATLKYTISN